MPPKKTNKNKTNKTNKNKTKLNMPKLKTLSSCNNILNSSLLLFVITIAAIVNIFYLWTNQDNESLFLFIFIAFIVYTQDGRKNMILVLGVPFVVVNLLIYARKQFNSEGLESGSHHPPVEKKIKKTEKKPEFSFMDSIRKLMNNPMGIFNLKTEGFEDISGGCDVFLTDAADISNCKVLMMSGDSSEDNMLSWVKQGNDDGTTNPFSAITDIQFNGNFKERLILINNNANLNTDDENKQYIKEKLIDHVTKNETTKGPVQFFRKYFNYLSSSTGGGGGGGGGDGDDPDDDDP